MNTRLNAFVMTSAALLLGLTWTGSIMAQEQKLASDMPKPQTDRVSCEEVDWHRDILRDYPWVSNACHEAVVVDGEKWARFEAEFQRLNRDGTIVSNFKNDRGRSLGSVSLKPGPNQRVLLDGEPTRFSDLRRGQMLNFYVPEGVYGFTTEPGATDDQLVDIVPTEDPEATESPRMAQAEPERTQRPARLPATAGPLPIIALGGLLSLLGGATLTMRRRFKKPNA
ncbi:hypothetical protein G4Y73_12730 [Wenzhouxiangella sp. XN201]|uniref:hypothetical protein n=1 Tax=Wenzhouxiangella sp. XN201 TaxID=2710755 RepID=UPI0013CAFA23|nr:hypothetical protein [Wenzhouxiangella sp. XN201]NEZ05016.1 hypothetical protein [Wenzhouxiangella sp. XN201]